MPQRRAWVGTLIQRLKRSGNPEAKLDEMVEPNADVLGLGVSTTELTNAVTAMRDDLRSLSRDIRKHLERYQEYLQAAEQTDGIDATDYKMDAQAELEDAQEKRTEYDALAKKYQVLRRALKKWERVQRRKQRQREYEVDLTQIDIEAARRKIEELEEEGQIEQQNADRLRRQLDMLGTTAEPDLGDVNKDLAELEKDRLSSKRDDDWDLDTVSDTDDTTDLEDTSDPLTMEDLQDL